MMPILDHFSIFAPYYERFIPLRDPKKLIRLAKLPVRGAILDAGGGTGRVTQAFRGMADLLVVVDISQKMLSEAKEKDGLAPVCSHTERLPFPDEYFERVIMVDALHHVGSQIDTVNEMWRVLKSGGRLVIEEPDIQHFPVKLIAIAEKLALMRSNFLSPEIIQGFFIHPMAHSFIAKEEYNAWIVVEKYPKDGD